MIHKILNDEKLKFFKSNFSNKFRNFSDELSSPNYKLHKGNSYN